MLKTGLALTLLLCLFTYARSDDSELDYDDDDGDLEDCHYDTDFKTLKKTPKLALCSSLENSSLNTPVQLQIYVNHTDEKIRLRALSLSSTPRSSATRSLVALTTDITDDYKYPTSLLIIDDFHTIDSANLRSIILSLIKANLTLLSRNVKKTLIAAQGGHKKLLSCRGTLYPKQDLKALNITLDFTKAITCSKEPQSDRFFTLQEKMYLSPSPKATFRLVDIHQDDPTKISRTSWYTCNNPVACTSGAQNKDMLDKTVHYALKFLQKARTEKKSVSG